MVEPGLGYLAVMNRIMPALLLATLAVPFAALAQGGPASPFKPVGGTPKPASGIPRQPAPPALPGSRGEPDAVTPAERAAADMPPTEALFDAINRGDLATARDSLNRGADLNATNVLGLSPLDLAIDLGRNEISFLLLSLRGGGGYSAARVPAAAPAPVARTLTRAERAEAARAERASRQVSARAATPTAPQTARLFAGNGGAPSPQAGFLGFDGGR